MSLIPEGTTRVSILGRHTLSQQDGPNETRTLRPEGITLCHSVQIYYAMLLSFLESRFGSPSFFCSEMARSFATVWEITHAPHITRDSRLNLLASLKKIQDGAWFKSQKEASAPVPEMLRMFLADPVLAEGQPFSENANNYMDWATDDGDRNVRITFAHEVACSLAVSEHVDDKDLGLSECQAFMLCMDDNGFIQKVIKITPPATI